MKWYEFVVVLFIGMIAAYLIIGATSTPASLNIDEGERWGDLNNREARNRFCQAMGFSEGRISENTGFGGAFESDYAGSPYGYNIVCKGSVPTKQIYDYDTYKKWLLNLELNINKS